MSKNKIAVGILRWDEQVPDTEMLFNDEPSVRRLINRFDGAGRLRVCYEAGPTGFGLYRLLRSMGVACEVIAPRVHARGLKLSGAQAGAGEHQVVSLGSGDQRTSVEIVLQIRHR